LKGAENSAPVPVKDKLNLHPADHYTISMQSDFKGVNQTEQTKNPGIISTALKVDQSLFVEAGEAG